MPPDNPREQELAPLKELEIQPSTIETIDRALFEYIDEELDIFCTTNKGFKKVPFIWAGAERAFQIKHDRELRDVNGFLIYPIMSLERTGITKNLTDRGAYYAAAQNIGDAKGGSMTVARVIKQDKTANFDELRKEVLENIPNFSRINELPKKSVIKTNNIESSFLSEKIFIRELDYYYTNSISRSSKTMSECRQIRQKIKKDGTNN